MSVLKGPGKEKGLPSFLIVYNIVYDPFVIE